MRTLCLFILLTSSAIAARADDLSFAGQVLPLLRSRCLVCHIPGGESGDLSLHPTSAYENLVGVKSAQSPLLRVSPGKPEESYLFLKLTGEHLRAGGTGERQPFGEAPLSTEDIDLVRRWIATGAKP